MGNYRKPPGHDRDHGTMIRKPVCAFPAMIECGGKGASRPFRAVFAVLTGWDASGG